MFLLRQTLICWSCAHSFLYKYQFSFLWITTPVLLIQLHIFSDQTPICVGWVPSFRSQFPNFYLFGYVSQCLMVEYGKITNGCITETPDFHGSTGQKVTLTLFHGWIGSPSMSEIQILHAFSGFFYRLSSFPLITSFPPFGHVQNVLSVAQATCCMCRGSPGPLPSCAIRWQRCCCG